jgi:peptide/nickel transport system permease protein
LRKTWRYAATRLVHSVPVVFGVTVATFLLLHLIPVDPARKLVGAHAGPAAVAAVRRQLGLDGSLFSQFALFLSRLAHGDTGNSFFYGVSTRSLVLQRLPVTAALVALAAVFCVVITLPLATIAAVRKDRLADHAIRVIPLVGLGMPAFWVGILLIIVFSINLGWFQVGGWGVSPGDHARALVLPAITAALGIIPLLIRSLRAGVLDVLKADFVATARAKGLREVRVLFLHVTRNALIPTVALLGLNIAYLIGSTVIVERVFDLQGLGSLMLDAVGNRDFPVVEGVTLVFAVAVVALNLATDLVAAQLDPRIRLG